MSAPTVTSIYPASGPANGSTSVTITGTNFTGATGVTIGGAAATGVSVVNDSTISCTTPTGSGGTASVLVTTPDGTNAANTLYTYVLTPPTVASISPTSGVSTGGTTVTLTGTNFTAATGVTFRGVAATSLTVVSSTSIICTTPAGSVGTASVLVTTPSGANAANNLFNYVPPPPTVSSVSPSTGSTLGGNTLTLTGTYFTEAGGVTIGGVAATNVTVVSSTSITCTTPAGSVGTASVLVTTAGGTNAGNTLFTYALTPPTVSSISPAIGSSVGGTSVTITGAYFTGTTGVTIGGVAATLVAVVNDTTLTCTTPAGTPETLASVVVTTPTGHNADNNLFNYKRALPTVTSVSPTIGTSAGGTRVTITGAYFSGVTGVSFNNVAATGITLVSDTSLMCTTPAGNAGVGSVQVTTAIGTSASNSLYLFVQGVPTDTYIYLKGGRGDGFVPQWTGASTDTEVSEKSDTYRNIFQTTAETAVSGINGVTSSGKITLPGLLQTVRNLYPVSYSVDANLSYTAGTLSDEAAGTAPRQFSRAVTWRSYTSSNGLVYHFRLADILGTGSQPRSE